MENKDVGEGGIVVPSMDAIVGNLDNVDFLNVYFGS